MTKTIKLTVLAMAAVILASCGGSAGPTAIEVTAGGASSPFEVTSSGTYTSTKTFSTSKDGDTTITKASSHYIALSNYELDTSFGMASMGKALTADGQVRLTFQIVGEEGTDDKAPFKTGTYSTKADKFNKLDYVNVAQYIGGGEKKTSLNIAKAEGEVKITAVSDEAVSGEINVTEGTNVVKGTFTAKITPRR